MTTVRELITDSLIEIGVIDPGEPLDAGTAQFALRTLARMLDRWSSEDLMIYTIKRNEFTLTANQQDYTLGTGGDFNIPAPAGIDMVSILQGGTIPEVPVEIVSPAQWRDIAVKSTTSSYPTRVWIRKTEPLETLSFWPVPTDGSTKAAIYHWTLIGPYTSLDDVIQLPEGYEEAVMTNLAVYLAGPFKATIQPSLSQRAMTSKRNIELQNPTDWSVGTELTPIAISSFGIVVDED